MQGNKKETSLFLAGVVSIFLILPACIGLNKRIQEDPFQFKATGLSPYPEADAQAVLNQILSKNQNLETVKGIGTFRFSYKEDHFSSRVAWIGGNSSRIRLEILGPSGQPTASLAADGIKLYYNSHADDKFYEKKLTDNALKSYLKIPLSVAEMVDFLCGRIPVDGYDRFALSQSPQGNGRVLYIRQKDQNRIIKLIMADKNQTVSEANLFTSKNQFDFHVGFGRYKTVGGFQIPFDITIADDKGAEFALTMDRVWANVSVDAGIFSLQPH